MWTLSDFSRLFSVLLIIVISWAAAVNYGSVGTAKKSSCSGTEGDFRFCIEATPAAIIAPKNDPDRQTVVHPRKVSLACGLTIAKAFGQRLALSTLSNGVSFSALITQFKSPSLFALHSCLTV
jgi:hypothetical protein